MTAVVFVGAPSLPPQPPASPWTSMQHTWTGFNGRSWNLSTRESGIFLKSGTRGLGVPQFTDQWLEGAAVDGARWLGAIAEKRDVFWPVSVFHDGGSEAWVAHDRALFRTFNRRKPGVWSVTNPATSETRRLPLRFKDDGDFAPDTDPSLIGWASYGLSFVAEQPFWVGETISQVWGQAEAPRNFYGGGAVNEEGGGPSFFIGSSVSMSTASISNPGDEDAWPIWTVMGPCTNTTVGVDGKLIQIPVSLSAGQWLQINTLKQTVVYGSSWVNAAGEIVSYTTPGTVPNIAAGTRRIPDGLGQVAFAEVPAGEDVPLAISMTGAGTVQVDLVPFFHRAW